MSLCRTVGLVLLLGVVVGCASSSRTTGEQRYRATLDEAVAAVEMAFLSVGLEIDEPARRDMSRAGRYYLEGYDTAALSGGGYSGRPVRVARITATLQLQPDGTVGVLVRNEQGRDVRLPGGSDPSERRSGDRYVQRIVESLNGRLARVEAGPDGA